jgi:hypothetical protein
MTRRRQIYEASGITVTYDPNPLRARRRVRTRSPSGVRSAGETLDLAGTGHARRTGRGGRALAARVVARLLEHGPLLVSGPIRVETEAGEVMLEADKASLCRCTGNPSFCDGSHARRTFRPTR